MVEKKLRLIEFNDRLSVMIMFMRMHVHIFPYERLPVRLVDEIMPGLIGRRSPQNKRGGEGRHKQRQSMPVGSHGGRGNRRRRKRRRREKEGLDRGIKVGVFMRLGSDGGTDVWKGREDIDWLTEQVARRILDPRSLSSTNDCG
jgi:hypothetical protein